MYPDPPSEKARWLTVISVCSGVLMVALDTTIVSVALPTIREDMDLADSTLVWTVNAFILPFGGAMLIGGRLGDVYGCGKVFAIGLGVFTVASLACGLSTTPLALITARAVQGLGGAIVVAVALSLVMHIFAPGAERAKALALYAFVCSGGGSLGLLCGGVLTSTLGWHWVFLVNVPIGIAVYLVSRPRLRAIAIPLTHTRLDVWGAITGTASLTLLIYLIDTASRAHWSATQSVLCVAFVLLLTLFLVLESRVPIPLLPLRVFKRRSIASASLICILWASGTWVWFVLSALYMHGVLGCGPMEIALAFLPANLIMATFSLCLSAKAIARFGVRTNLVAGLLVGAFGLALLAQAPADGEVLIHVLPSMIAIGLGMGIVSSPLILAAIVDAAPEESGLVSGIVNTMSLMGGALGLAVLTALGAGRTEELLTEGLSLGEALSRGYRIAFMWGAVCATVAAVLGATLLDGRERPRSSRRDVLDVGRTTKLDGDGRADLSQEVPSRARSRTHFP